MYRNTKKNILFWNIKIQVYIVYQKSKKLK